MRWQLVVLGNSVRLKAIIYYLLKVSQCPRVYGPEEQPRAAFVESSLSSSPDHYRWVPANAVDSPLSNMRNHAQSALPVLLAPR